MACFLSSLDLLARETETSSWHGVRGPSPWTFPTGCVDGRQQQGGSEWPCDLNRALLSTACGGGDTADSPAEICVGGRGARSGLRKMEEAFTKDLKL